MVWSYDGDPTGDRKDEVRFLVGDTDQTDPLVQDEEITFVLTQYPPVDGKPAWLAAAHICDGIASKFARKIDRSVSSLSQQASQMYDHYKERAADLRALHASNGLATTGMGSIRAAIPRLGGGGPTRLDGGAYMSPEGLS